MKSSARHAGSVLVVDDETASATLVGRLLRRGNYSVETAHDGATALMLIEHHPFDLVLLDVVMPGLSGFDVCRRIRIWCRSSP